MASEQHDFLFLMANMEENWRLARQAEDKRARLASVNLLAASALQIALVFAGFHPQSVFITIWMTILGIYGIIAGCKLYERSQFHIRRARAIRTTLDNATHAGLETLFAGVEAEHMRAYPRLSGLRLNHVWTALHACIALLGVVLTTLTLTH